MIDEDIVKLEVLITSLTEKAVELLTTTCKEEELRSLRSKLAFAKEILAARKQDAMALRMRIARNK